MTARKKGRRSPNHIFRFQLDNGEVAELPARVVYARKRVDLILEAEHVEESIRLGGVGNTARCTMAICSKRQAGNFPHAVEGHVDWYLRRAYVLSKTRKGVPTECVVYRHGDEIARLNDTPGGQAKLLKILQDGGPRVVTLLPMRKRTRTDERRRADSVCPPTRSRVVPAQGAKLRIANSIGGVAAPVKLPRKISKNHDRSQSI